MEEDISILTVVLLHLSHITKRKKKNIEYVFACMVHCFPLDYYSSCVSYSYSIIAIKIDLNKRLIFNAEKEDKRIELDEEKFEDFISHTCKRLNISIGGQINE